MPVQPHSTTDSLQSNMLCITTICHILACTCFSMVKDIKTPGNEANSSQVNPLLTQAAFWLQRRKLTMQQRHWRIQVESHDALECFGLIKKQVIRVQKLIGLPPPHSNYLGVFFSFRRTFGDVITFGEALTHKF